jgi:hypothetical protein
VEWRAEDGRAGRETRRAPRQDFWTRSRATRVRYSSPPPASGHAIAERDVARHGLDKIEATTEGRHETRLRRCATSDKERDMEKQ